MFETTLGAWGFGLILSFFSVVTVVSIARASVKSIKF